MLGWISHSIRRHVRSDREVHDVSARDLEECRLFNSLLATSPIRRVSLPT